MRNDEKQNSDSANSSFDIRHSSWLPSHTGISLAPYLGVKLPKVATNGAARHAGAGDGPARSKRSPATTHITVRGARQHNLKGIDVEIPRVAMSVCCGPSGSG
jgi:hypothetical protein